MTSTDLARAYADEPQPVHSTCHRCTRPHVAVWDLPNGEAWCQACLLYVMPRMAAHEQMALMLRLGSERREVAAMDARKVTR